MGILNIFKNKENGNDTQLINKTTPTSIAEFNNYMLADVRKTSLVNANCLPLEKLAAVAPFASETIKNIQTVTGNAKKDTLYRITNLGANDVLKASKDGTKWGAIKTSGGASTMAKLKEVNNMAVIDPSILMMSVAIASLEKEVSEIKEITKRIVAFLEHEKEAEIESDLEILNRSISDFKYNLTDEKYITNNHKQVMDIKRTANKNMLFYRKEINDLLVKDKLITTDSTMNVILESIQKKFKYYRLSLYIYSFATLMEVLMLKNYNEEYLISKKQELDDLDNEYINDFNKALEYVKKNADKSIEGNLLSGLGSAGKAIGNLALKVNVKKVESWLNEKGENLKQTGKNIKENYIVEFDEMKVTNTHPFINQIVNVNTIYNKTKDIFFDNKNIYIQ